ncbi:MAG: type II secretion system protein [Kiritimatiellae bacterium]|nr:type II secretion system protein [Kiritimatiellia bacterium]
MKRRGFTMVELLVVVGIILLLMTILIPSISGVQRRGVRMTDLSNIRQMSIALLSMAQDSNGSIPRGERVTGGVADDMVWMCGPTITSLNTKYGVEKKSLSCITYLNTTFYRNTVGKVPLSGTPDGQIGWMYWGSRAINGPNNRVIMNLDGSSSGVPYQMPRRLSSPMTTRTLITCMAYTSPHSAWPGWMPHAIANETGVSVPSNKGPFKDVEVVGLNMGFVDGSARWVLWDDLGAIRDVDWCYYDRTAK